MTIPGNPHAQRVERLDSSTDAYVIAQSALALAYEQHQRNRLAAITAAHRGIHLPTDLEDLATEGFTPPEHREAP